MSSWSLVMWKEGDKVSVWGADSGIVTDCEIYSISPELGVVQTRHIPSGVIGLFEIDDLVCPHSYTDLAVELCNRTDPNIPQCDNCPIHPKGEDDN